MVVMKSNSKNVQVLTNCGIPCIVICVDILLRNFQCCYFFISTRVVKDGLQAKYKVNTEHS